jgi:hypothetical protein
MADDKGSDLDIFEGLTKKKKSVSPGSETPGASVAPPPAPSTAASPSLAAPTVPQAKLPPPKKTLLGMSPGGADGEPVSMPKPNPPPRKPASAPPAAMSDLDADLMPEATAEIRRPTKQEIEQLMRGEDPDAVSAAAPEAPVAATAAPAVTNSGEAPAVAPTVDGPSVSPSLVVVEESDAPADSVPPEEVSAVALDAEEGLDWDDENESTSVFGKAHAAELFGDLAGERITTATGEGTRPDANARPEISAAAALLAGSGKAASVASAAGMPSVPYDVMPKIPAPAPVPREIIAAQSFDSSPAPAAASRPPTSEWAPSVPATAPAAEKPAGRSTGLIAGAAVVALGLGALLWSRSCGPGTLVVRVEHNGKPVDTAQVYVDGQQVCTFVPCRVKNVDPGKRDVRVASGQLAGQGSIEVKGGSGETELTIQLGLASGEAPAAASGVALSSSAQPAPVEAQKPAALSLKSAITDKVKVFVDGQEKGTLPLELKDLKPGEVTLRFEPAGDRYGKLERTYTLEAGKTLAVDDLKLPLKTVAVTFKLETPGAAVKLVEEGKPGTPLVISGGRLERKLDTASKWKVVATMKGHADFEQAVVFEEDKPTLTVSIKLDKADAPAAAPPAEPASAPTPAATQAPAAEAASGGSINANSLPPSSVLIDGRPHGQTPVTGVRVPAGSHTVVFKHKDFGIQSRSVTVAPGKTATVTVKFDVSGGGSGGDDKPKKKKKADDE